MIPEAHLKRDKTVKRSMSRGQAYPLTESSMPMTNGTPHDTLKIVEWLDVEKSERYQPTRSATFCNIYAHDFAERMGKYIPRVWWTDKAIKNEDFKETYGGTVRKQNVNSLYDWFPKYGSEFGWTELANKSQAQKFANEGRFVVMLAANKDPKRSGHITVVVPETDTVKAMGSRGIYIWPVQSQAGRVNKKIFCSEWWKGMRPVRIYMA